MAVLDSDLALRDLNQQLRQAQQAYKNGLMAGGFNFSWVFSPTITAAQVGATNTIRLFRFPDGVFLMDWASKPTDMDTDGTPAIVYDIVVLNSANVEGSTKIVSGSTAAQAGTATDSIAAGAKGLFVGGLWACMKVTTAADVGAAGSIRCVFTLANGVLSASPAANGQPQLNVAV